MNNRYTAMREIAIRLTEVNYLLPNRWRKSGVFNAVFYVEQTAQGYCIPTRYRNVYVTTPELRDLLSCLRTAEREHMNRREMNLDLAGIHW